jgi:RNA polymerase sigma factor (sigma-70 family)
MAAGVWVDAPPGGSGTGRSGLAALSDGALLQRFATGREQPAFAELVRRYGDSVHRVCTRILGDADRARDASQAAFVALARRAAGLDARGPLAGWLHTVAGRLARRLRIAAARQRRLERIAAERLARAAGEDPPEIERAEVWRVLRDELGRLPEEYRVPLVLCYLDGRTHAEVARVMGMPRGSVAKRVAEGLRRLRDRLERRGFPL